MCDSFICVPWLIHLCAMTHSFVCHDSSTYAHSTCMNDATWCIYIWDQTYLRTRIRPHYWFTYMNDAALLIHIHEWGDITDSCIWMRRHYVFTCMNAAISIATRLICTSDVTHSFVCHDSLCVFWVIFGSRGTHYRVASIVFCMNAAISIATTLIRTRGVTHLFVCHDSLCVYEWGDTTHRSRYGVATASRID